MLIALKADKYSPVTGKPWSLKDNMPQSWSMIRDLEPAPSSTHTRLSSSSATVRQTIALSPQLCVKREITCLQRRQKLSYLVVLIKILAKTFYLFQQIGQKLTWPVGDCLKPSLVQRSWFPCNRVLKWLKREGLPIAYGKVSYKTLACWIAKVITWIIHLRKYPKMFHWVEKTFKRNNQDTQISAEVSSLRLPSPPSSSSPAFLEPLFYASRFHIHCCCCC